MTTELMNMNDVNGTNDMHNVEEEAANAVAEALTTTADEGGGTGTTPQIAIEELAKSGKLPLHPYCTLFPPASEAAITSLAEDIRKNGLHYRITLKKGEVVDGQWRYNACLKAGEPFEPFEKYFIEYDGDTSDAGLLRFVMSRNVQRRQLSESQKGIIAAKMTRKKNVHDANPQICGFTQKQAAEMMCVSESMVRDGVRLLREGTPELIAKVECGAIKIHKALEQCVAHSENNPESNKIVGTGTDQDDKDVQGSVQDSNTVSSDTSKIEDGGTTPENLSDDPSVGTPEQVNELPTVDTTDIGSEPTLTPNHQIYHHCKLDRI